MSLYRIADEPEPSGLARWAVRPFWPLLATMLAGAWLGLPWFAFNGFAAGSPTRRAEASIAVVGVGAGLALSVLLLELEARGVIASQVRIDLALLVMSLAKLGIAYAAFTLQSRSFELFEHFGGRVRNGLPLVLAGAFVLRQMILTSISWVALRMALS